MSCVLRCGCEGWDADHGTTGCGSCVDAMYMQLRHPSRWLCSWAYGASCTCGCISRMCMFVYHACMITVIGVLQSCLHVGCAYVWQLLFARLFRCETGFVCMLVCAHAYMHVCMFVCTLACLYALFPRMLTRQMPALTSICAHTRNVDRCMKQSIYDCV